MNETPALNRSAATDRLRNCSHLRSRKSRRALPNLAIASCIVLTAASLLLKPSLLGGGIGDVDRNYTSTTRSCVSTHETASPYYDAKTRRNRDSMVEALDRIRSKVEEWGVVTISAPVAVLDPTAFSVPDDIVLPSAAYASARSDVEASAVQATEVGISNQLGATVVPTIIPPVPRPPTGGTATQNTTTTTTVTAPGGPVASSSAPAAAAPTPVPNPNDQELPPVAPTPATLAPINLGTIPAPGKSVAEALREAQDNTMRQKIYKQMSYPKGIKDYNTVIFAIVEVSCNPGWRTKEHYIAECSASLEYSDLCSKEHVSLSEQRLPIVFSVLPLLDAQTVEMANSQREVTQLAFQLAASLPAHGVNVRAKDLFQFVRRYSRDLRSRTPIPVVNSFSSGGTFGFRFSPSFQAMRDPAQKNARAGNVLLPTSFPALVTVVMHNDDIEHVVNESKQKGGEPGLLTHVSTRWFLKDRPPLWQLPKRLFTPMRRDTAEMGVTAAEEVAKYYSLKDSFERIGTSEQGKFNPMYEEARRSIIALQAKGIGRDWPIPLNDAFLEQKRRVDGRTQARVERTETQNDYIQDVQQEVQAVNFEKEVDEAKALKANTISISVTDEKGRGKTIAFDKRPFGNVSGDKLVDFIQELALKSQNVSTGETGTTGATATTGATGATGQATPGPAQASTGTPTSTRAPNATSSPGVTQDGTATPKPVPQKSP
jgi:hypothetical protein